MRFKFICIVYRYKSREEDYNAEGESSPAPMDRSVNSSSDPSESSSGALNTVNIIDPHDPAMYAGKRLSEDDKLLLLTSTWKASSTFKFPVTSGQRFSPSWLDNRPWLRYSIRNDRVFCTSCMCFSNLSESPFVCTGFKIGKKLFVRMGIDQHKHSKNHRIALYFYRHVSQEQISGQG